jgi:hypothetical protein
MLPSRRGRFLGRFAATALLSLSAACSLTPLSITGHFDSDAKLLEQGALAQFNADAAATQLRQQIPLLYSYAYEAGLITDDANPPEVGTSLKKSDKAASPTFSDKTIADEETQLLKLKASDWLLVAQAGETSIDLSCSRYEAALYELDKNRKVILANLNATQSASVAIMGLALAAQKSIAIVATAFGLAASLFDTSVNSVLFQLPPASVVSVIDAQRDVYRSKETQANAGWSSINNPIAVANRLNEYIRYCTPPIIEANVGKLLGQTKLDQNTGKLTAETEPATQPTTQTIQRAIVMPTETRKQVLALTPTQALLVWQAMAPALARRPQSTQGAVRNRLGIQPTAMWEPTTASLSEAQAKAAVNEWIVLDEGTEPNKAEWTKALESAGPAAPARAPQPQALKPTARPAASVTPSPAAADLQKQIALLSAADALELAGLMYPDLSDRPKTVQDKLHGFVASKGALTQANAPLFLALWLESDNLEAAFQKQWQQTLSTVQQQVFINVPASKHFPAAFRTKIFALRASQALQVAKVMYSHLGERSPEVKSVVDKVGVASADDLSVKNAGSFLNRWITFDLATDVSQTEWQSALDSLSH